MAVITGCAKKSVKLPLLNVPGIQDVIYDNTQIWMFYDEETPTPSLSLNKHNKISGTHWIFNIDKRLPMHLVVPELKKLLDKRKKPGMHSVDKVLFNYFSYVDSVQDALSMVKFDAINYSSEVNESTNSEDSTALIKDLKIDESDFSINDSLIKPDHLAGYFDKQTANTIRIALSFDENITYARYVFVKAILANLLNDRIRLSATEQMMNAN